MGMGATFGKDVGKKVLKDRVQALMRHNNVSADLQRMVIFAIDNTVEYIDLCVKLKKSPDDPAVLANFLFSKGVYTAKLASDDLKCAVSIVEFANGLRKNIPKAGGGPIPATVVVALTLVDVLSIGNNCTFVQEAYYHAFLETSHPHQGHVPLHPRRSEIKPTSAPNAFWNSLTPDVRSRCEFEKGSNQQAEALSLKLL